MSNNSKIYKFPPLPDKFSEGVFTKSQWLIDYISYRESVDESDEVRSSLLKYQSSVGKNSSVLADRYRGSLLGLAAGDALGTTLEFCPRPESVLVTQMVGKGPFNLHPGQWTDDTSMSLCLAHSLLRKKTFDGEDQMDLYVSWWKNGSFSSTGTCFDIGSATSNALQRYIETGIPYAGSDDARTAGNGSLMRLAPVVLFYASDPRDAIFYSGESSKTTHKAIECIDACRLFSALLLGALYGESKETILSDNYSPVKKIWETKPLTSKVNSISRGDYKNKTRDEIKSTGYVIDSLQAALWAFYNSESFEEGAIQAVNLGGDADSIGAIYGQLAGAFYGESGIPVRWIKKLSYYHVFYLYADELVEYYSGKPIIS